MGLKKEDKIEIDYGKIETGKFFYDVIYNPAKTEFLNKAQKYGHIIENGKFMFIYQAHQAFTIWHKKMPDIDKETLKLIDEWLKLVS